MKKKIVQTIAILCIIIGLFYLIKSYKAHFWFITMLFDERYAQRAQNPLGANIILISYQVILMLRPIVGLELLKLKTWGRNFTIIVLSADFVLRVISFINAHTYALRHPEMADKVAEMIANGAEVSKVSMIPSYFIAAISLVSVIILIKTNLNELNK